MSEIRDRIREKMAKKQAKFDGWDWDTQVGKVDKGMYLRYANQILSIPELARALLLLEVISGASDKRYELTCVDRKAELPSNFRGERTVLMEQLHNAGWVKEVLNGTEEDK